MAVRQASPQISEEDEKLIEAINEHLDSLQNVTGWGILLAAGIFVAGVVNADEINIFGTKIHYVQSSMIVGIIYIGITFYAGILISKIERLFWLCTPCSGRVPAASMIAHHTWFLSPFANFGGRRRLPRWLINHLGIIIASMGWSTAFYSLARMTGDLRSFQWLTSPLIWVLVIAVGSTLYSIISFSLGLYAQRDAMAAQPRQYKDMEEVIYYLGGSFWESLLAIFAGVGLAAVLIALTETSSRTVQASPPPTPSQQQSQRIR